MADNMKLSKKAITISVAGTLVISIIATTVFVCLQKSPASTDEAESKNPRTNLVIQVPSSNPTENPSNSTTDENSNSKINLDVGGNTSNSSSNVNKNPTVSDGGVSQGTKNPPSNNTPTAIDKPSVDTPSKGGGSGVVGVTPVERPDEPVAPSGSKPQTTDWISVNPNVPQELYNYDYTVIDQADLLTGKQLEYRGFNDWNKAAEAAVGALTTYYTVDYRNIGSTVPKDKDQYLRSLVYWVGESAE